MRIDLWPISQVRPYANNPRINQHAIEPVAASIRQFGFRQPIVVDAEGVIVCGHTRFEAAKLLGLETVPVHLVRDLTPEQIRAYRLADNKTGALATWDLAKLPSELAALLEAEFDLEQFGFSGDELRELLSGGVKAGLTDPDEVPAPPDQAVTQRGDLWLLGEHRLLCGDSAKPEDMDQLVDGNSVQLVNTDPPYNVRVEPRSNNAIAAGLSSFGNERAAKNGKVSRGKGAFGPASGHAETGAQHHRKFDLARRPGKAKATHKKLRAKDRPLANDFVSDSEFERLLRAWFANAARALEAGRGFYLWGGYANCANYPPILKATGLYFSQAIIWVKEHPVLTRKDFMGNHEWCFYGWREGAAHQFFGPNNVPDVWSVKKVNPLKMVHLTEKPVELAVRALQYSSRAGERVLDLFAGSGSTLIAAQQTGRQAYLMELDPLYCDVIVARYEQFTGCKAQRRATGTIQLAKR